MHGFVMNAIALGFTRKVGRHNRISALTCDFYEHLIYNNQAHSMVLATNSYRGRTVRQWILKSIFQIRSILH